MTGQPEDSDPQRYRLDSRIATGGMGEVWRATDIVLDREVAVKVLKAEYADDPIFRARFQAEARHAASLQHPNVASVFDFGEMPADDGSDAPRPFLVMELVPGQPLSVTLRAGEPMPPQIAADLMAQAADGVAAAHALDIVHRDVKPANLLVTPEGMLKITDFGIARAADGLALTQTGQVIGTPHYLSPEQAEGHPATAASDIYALGVVLYECLAGRRPFSGDTPVTTALAHLRDPVPDLPESVPVHLRDVVARALAKDPADRFASAADMATSLRGGPVGEATPTLVDMGLVGAAGGADSAATTQVLTNRHGDTGRDRRTLPVWWLVAAAAVGVLLVIGLSNLLGGGGEGDTSGGGPTATPSVTQTPQDDRIRVRRAVYLGMDAKEAKERLESLDFEVRDEKVPATSPDQEKDTVAAVSPFGLVEPGSTITLTLWEEYEAPDEGDKHGPNDGKNTNPGKAKGKN